jgi:hypothetical protein
MSDEIIKRQGDLIKYIESNLEKFAEMVKNNKESEIVLHQDAFAADLQEQEYILGKAIKYAGLRGRNLKILA